MHGRLFVALLPAGQMALAAVRLHHKANGAAYEDLADADADTSGASPVPAEWMQGVDPQYNLFSIQERLFEQACSRTHAHMHGRTYRACAREPTGSASVCMRTDIHIRVHGHVQVHARVYTHACVCVCVLSWGIEGSHGG